MPDISLKLLVFRLRSGAKSSPSARRCCTPRCKESPSGVRREKERRATEWRIFGATIRSRFLPSPHRGAQSPYPQGVRELIPSHPPTNPHIRGKSSRPSLESLAADHRPKAKCEWDLRTKRSCHRIAPLV